MCMPFAKGMHPSCCSCVPDRQLRHDCAAPVIQAVMPFEGGEAAGLRRLKQYVWESDAVAHYAETRNGTAPCQVPANARSMLGVL
jgi:deoxyribodipyrimidine photolyase